MKSDESEFTFFDYKIDMKSNQEIHRGIDKFMNSKYIEHYSIMITLYLAFFLFLLATLDTITGIIYALLIFTCFVMFDEIWCSLNTLLSSVETTIENSIPEEQKKATVERFIGFPKKLKKNNLRYQLL